MHKLDRDPVAPAGLGKYKHGKHKWNGTSPDPTVRKAIWNKLNAMQGGRCAYCEAAIDPTAQHIEHFVQKGRVPEQTFVWDNLFGSCERNDSCGKHKDHPKLPPYADADLIKPDVDDPEQLLVFEPFGAVRPRQTLSVRDAQRAAETIRVFNLNGALKAIRRVELTGYLQTAEMIAEFWALDPVLGQQALADELAATAHLPFATAIKHVLSNQSALENQA